MTIAESTNETEIRTLLDRWAAAVRAQDLPRITVDHAKDILMFDLPGPTQTSGLTAYTNSWPQLFEWFKGSGIFDLSEVRVTAGTDVAFATGLIRCKGTEKNGDVVTLSVRLTVGLKKLSGRWTVTHEHHSIPAD